MAAGLFLCACSPSGTHETALGRGDVAFARDSLDEALAEYRLAVRQGSDGAPVLARVAHTYVRLGRVDEALDYYRQATTADSTWRDQAASDFIHLARQAARRDDRFQMASAIEAAVAFRPGVSVQDVALSLARHFFQNGEYGRALPFYQRALATAADSVPDLVFEIGQAYEEIGDCRRALVYFERFRETIPRWQRDEVDWYVGSCAYQLAVQGREAAKRMVQDAGDDLPALPRPYVEALEAALVFVNRTVEVGAPRNMLGQAWFERAEILASLGECDAALSSFERVRRIEPSNSTALSRRAQERHDQIRFGTGLREFASLRPCG